MASGGHQRSYWPVPPDWRNGQLRQVKSDDVSSGGDLVRNVGGGSWTAKYRESCYLPGIAVTESAVPGLWSGF